MDIFIEKVHSWVNARKLMKIYIELSRFFFKPEGRQLANRIIVGLNFGGINTKYRNRSIYYTYTDINA